MNKGKKRKKKIEDAWRKDCDGEMEEEEKITQKKSDKKRRKKEGYLTWRFIETLIRKQVKPRWPERTGLE